MATVAEARNAVGDFFKSDRELKDLKVIKIQPIADGWEMEVEVYEESAFIKSLGLPTQVQDRNIYAVRLDEQLNIQSYELKHDHKPFA